MIPNPSVEHIDTSDDRAFRQQYLVEFLVQKLKAEASKRRFDMLNA